MLITHHNALPLLRPAHAAVKPAFASPAAPLDQAVKSDATCEDANLGQRLMGFVKSLGKDEYLADLQRIQRAEQSAATLKTPAEFQAKTAAFKARLARGESFESLRVEAYAVARQAAVTATGMRPYDCQVMGALAMDHGRIAEMMTGEGKTLTAIMPLYLNALAGKGAHLVTVNDTLAQRDRDTVAPIFETLGLSVGCVLEDMTPEQKRAGYAADITYTTDRSVGFDYLRDRTARSVDDRVQRPLFFALVDEVDEVLLDEARTPLIISGQGQPASTDYLKFRDIVDDLKPGIDYFVDRRRAPPGCRRPAWSTSRTSFTAKPWTLRMPARSPSITSGPPACVSKGKPRRPCTTTRPASRASSPAWATTVGNLKRRSSSRLTSPPRARRTRWRPWPSNFIPKRTASRSPSLTPR
jgi:hypothetical protein